MLNPPEHICSKWELDWHMPAVVCECTCGEQGIKLNQMEAPTEEVEHFTFGSQTWLVVSDLGRMPSII